MPMANGEDIKADTKFHERKKQAAYNNCLCVLFEKHFTKRRFCCISCVTLQHTQQYNNTAY